ncbi:hypothetical protein GGI43DRAFT_113706 [Trichoderma evansii]
MQPPMELTLVRATTVRTCGDGQLWQDPCLVLSWYSPPHKTTRPSIVCARYYQRTRHASFSHPNSGSRHGYLAISRTYTYHPKGRSTTSCCRHRSSRPLLAESTPGPAAPPISRANEMPWSAEWLRCETLAVCTPNPFLHLLSAAHQKLRDDDAGDGATSTLSLWTRRRRHAEFNLSLSFFPSFAFSWLLFLLAFVSGKIRFSATGLTKPTLPLTNPLATQ